jgi:hypothetical protein
VAASGASNPATHWAFQPIRSEPIPSIHNTAWPRTEVDCFILAKLEEKGMQPAGPADKRTLLRRATYDLLGLPPTVGESQTFLNDTSSDAFAALVERLLASPQYGERWGRHWMDVVRYADTAGDNADYPIPEIYLYRDYMIDAFNADKPFDVFVREQLAGDILAKQGPPERYAESVTATGFLALSRRYGTGPYELWHLTLENTLETVGQAFLGLNLKCARCHDHKFDPVTTADYYGLYGVFASTEFPWAGSEEIQSKNFNRQKFVPLVPGGAAAAKLAAWQAKQQALREEIAALEKDKEADKKRLGALKSELRNLEKPGAPADLPVAYAVREGTPADAHVQLRGEPGNAGPIAPRCAPRFLASNRSLSVPEGSSGRLEFARWLTEPSHPLTARVMANRIWQHHFGKGLVATPNNFGLSGEPPTHGDLLDHLAARFIQSGWSVKEMHRLIMNSAVYQMASTEDAANLERDPANRSYWRFDRHRLEAESVRDAMLFTAGNLNLTRPGPHPFPPPEKWTWTQHAPFKERYDTQYRSVYLMTQRIQRHPFMALFDGPDTNSSTEARRVSIVPQQALFVLNDPFVDGQAKVLAKRVLKERHELAARIRYLVELTWGRPPSAREEEKYRGWLTEAQHLAGQSNVAPDGCEEEAWTSLCRVTLAANEFLYVD